MEETVRTHVDSKGHTLLYFSDFLPISTSIAALFGDLRALFGDLQFFFGDPRARFGDPGLF